MKERKRINDAHLWELKQRWDETRRRSGISEPQTDLAAIDLEIQRQRLQQEGVAIARQVGHRAAFVSANPCLDFEFLYPAPWNIQEFTVEDHNEVFILGPRNQEDTYSLAIVIHVFPALTKGGKFSTIAEVVDSYLRTICQQRNFQKLSQVHGTLAGFEAIEMAVRYTLPLPPSRTNPKDTPIIERRIILKRKGKFYELIYRAVEEDYYTFLPAFKALVRTFEFVDKPMENRDFYPLVLQSETQSVREQGSEYPGK